MSKIQVKTIKQIQDEIEAINEQILSPDNRYSLYRMIQLKRWLQCLQAMIEIKMGFSLPAHRQSWQGVMAIMRVLVHTYLTPEEFQFANTAK